MQKSRDCKVSGPAAISLYYSIILPFAQTTIC